MRLWIFLPIGLVFFGIGEYVKTIGVTIPGSGSYAAFPGNVTLTITSATSSSLATTQTVVSVMAARYAGRIVFQDSQWSGNESVGQAVIYLARELGASGVVTVFVTSTVSSAITNNQVKSTVTFHDGQTSAPLPIPIESSDEYSDRTFELRLSDPTGGAQVSSNTMKFHVYDKGDVSLPGYPSLLADSATGGMIRVVLNAPQFRGGEYAYIHHYEVELESPDGLVQLSHAYGTNVLSISHLQNDTTYKARGAAINQRGRGAFSESVNVSTTAATPPGVVAELWISEITGGAARLLWREPVDLGGLELARYEITAHNYYSGVTHVTHVNGSASSAAIGDLQAGGSYVFSIFAVNRAEMSGFATDIYATASFATPPRQPPPPVLVQATGGALHFNVVVPVDCGGWPLTSFTVYVARLSGWEINYVEFVTRTIESKSETGIVGNVSMYDLLSDSVYFVKVSIQSEYVSEPQQICIWTMQSDFRLVAHSFLLSFRDHMYREQVQQANMQRFPLRVQLWLTVSENLS